MRPAFRSIALVASAALAALLLIPALAAAQLSAEIDQGRAAAAAVQSGSRDCVDLSNEDFATMGESAMDRSIGDRAAHETMNRRMIQMMGRQGELRMHVALGYRSANCPGAPQYAWMGLMAEMMGSYSHASGTSVGPGMMGGTNPGSGHVNGAGYMHGGGSNDVNGLEIIGIALGSSLLGGLIVAGAMRSRRVPASEDSS